MSLLNYKLNTNSFNLNHFGLKKKYISKITNHENLINPIPEKNECNFKFNKTITNRLSNKKDNNYTACIFSSKKDNGVYIAYGTLSCDLECYDLIKNKKFILITKLYKDTFHSCRYFYDKQNNRDLIITSYSTDNHVKGIEFEKEKGELIFDLDFSNKSIIRTTFFINGILIILFINEINIFNLYLNQITKLEVKYNNFYSINNYFCKLNKKNLLFLSNDKGTIIYDTDINDANIYEINQIRFYKEFWIEDKRGEYIEAYIFEKESNIFLIQAVLEKMQGENLYLWNLENERLIYRINLGITLTDINIWNNDFIFANIYDDEDYGFILYNIKEKKIEKKYILNKKNKRIYGIKILKDSIKGDYLITLSFLGELDLYKIDD